MRRDSRVDDRAAQVRQCDAFYRLERLEEQLGVPLPAATQWEFVEEAAELSPYQVFGLADAIEFGSASWSIFTLSPTLCPAVSITKRSRFHVS